VNVCKVCGFLVLGKLLGNLSDGATKLLDGLFCFFHNSFCAYDVTKVRKRKDNNK
jgi:hypothetical protein